MVKIDVEGAELHVIKGMTKLLFIHKPFLYFECGSEPLFDQLMPILTDLEYTCYWHPSRHFREGNFYNATNLTGEAGDLNIFAIHKEKREAHIHNLNQLKMVEQWSDLKKLFPDFIF